MRLGWGLGRRGDDLDRPRSPTKRREQEGVKEEKCLENPGANEDLIEIGSLRADEDGGYAAWRKENSHTREAEGRPYSPTQS